MDEYAQKNYFNIRSVNVTKLTQLVDCDIVLSECIFALKVIERQFTDPLFSRDVEWRKSADIARTEIEHKRQLVALKRASVVDRIEAEKNRDPQNNFRGRFMKVAQKVLPPETFAEIEAIARDEVRE